MGQAEIISHDNEHGRESQMLTQDLWSEIRFMRKMGKSIKKISRELMISKNTVRKALRSELYHPYQRENCKPGLLSEFMPFLMERTPQLGFNATSLFRELQKLGYAGGYSMVKEAVRPLRETYRQIEAATARFETPPGLQAQVDWGSKEVMIGDHSTRIRIFVMVLGFSRAIYVEFTLDEKLPTLIACHENAFAWFGGIPEEILYDNPKTIVLDRATANARINPKFEDFCGYYGYTPRLCRPYRARTKGKVESGVKYVKRSFLPGQEFSSLADASEQVLAWVREVADQRIHGTTHEQPVARFQKENLRALTNRPPYQLQVCQMRRVANDCMISYASNRYSVPWKYVHQSVELQEHDDTLFIYFQGAIIATHRKSEAKYQVAIDMDHYRGLGLAPEPLVVRRKASPEVEVRSLAIYEALAEGGALNG
jgi:transposase